MNYKKHFKEANEKFPYKITLKGVFVNKGLSNSAAYKYLKKMLPTAQPALSFRIVEEDLLSLEESLGSFSDSPSPDLKVEFSWFLSDDENKNYIMIWNFKDGPKYNGIKDEDSEDYYMAVQEINTWSVWSNNVEVAKEFLASKGIKTKG